MTIGKGAPAPSTLQDLLARVEAATGPGRELDMRIAYGLRLVDPEAIWNGRSFYEAVDQFPDDVRGITNCWPLGIYTASLDAAVALVERELPEGCLWKVGRAGAAEIYGPGHRLPGGESTGYHDEAMFAGDADTPALALLAALLKALIAQQDTP